MGCAGERKEQNATEEDVQQPGHGSLRVAPFQGEGVGRGSAPPTKGDRVNRSLRWLLALLILAGSFVVIGIASSDTGDDVLIQPKEIVSDDDEDEGPVASGAIDFRDISLGSGITECPQAGDPLDKQPKPLDRCPKDKVEQRSHAVECNRQNT